MNQNLIEFKTTCRDAFRFLLDEHGFRELSEPYPKDANPFQVRFTNGIIEMLILGEGYGTAASVHYLTQDGTNVATQILEADWEPFKKRKKKRPTLSQRDQVLAQADRIKARDKDILNGDLSRLNAVATRWRSLCEKMQWK